MHKCIDLATCQARLTSGQVLPGWKKLATSCIRSQYLSAAGATDPPGPYKNTKKTWINLFMAWNAPLSRNKQSPNT